MWLAGHDLGVFFHQGQTVTFSKLGRLDEIRNEMITTSREPFVTDGEVDHWLATETVLAFVRRTVLLTTKLMNRFVKT